MAGPLPPLVDALEKRLGVPVGSLEGEDETRATEALADATEVALSYVPAARADAWRLDAAPGIVHVVILKAARREFENPQGYTDEGQGDHSASVGVASGAYLTPDEIASVKRAAGTGGYVGTLRIPSAYGYSPEPRYVMDDAGRPIAF